MNTGFPSNCILNQNLQIIIYEHHYQYTMYTKLHTVSIVVFKQFVNVVNGVHSTKVNFPPHGIVRVVNSYRYCSHTSCCVSINCVICIIIHVTTWIVLGLSSDFSVGQIICTKKINLKINSDILRYILLMFSVIRSKSMR